MATRMDGLHLVLWDIDHTLIETRGVGRWLYAAAFEAVTGRRMEHAADPTGRTEQAIFRETLGQHGVEPSADLQARYAAELPRQYEQHVDLLGAKGRALPGSRQALAALADRPEVIQTVLSGNFRAVAVTKLRIFGLQGHIDFEVGAYGEDDGERARLVAVAQRRAGEKYETRFNRHNTGIVGDTVNDVHAAHEGGARVVGVASGRDSVDDLYRAGAEIVLPDLTDTMRLVVAVTNL